MDKNSSPDKFSWHFTFTETHADFPAVTICQNYKMSGMQTYSDQRIPPETRELYQQINLQSATFGDTVFTAKNYTDYFAALHSDPTVFDFFAQNMTNLADPRTISANYIIQYFHRLLLGKVNPELLNLTSYQLQESLISCTFNLTYDCKQDKNLLSSLNPYINCFTFNSDGIKTSSSPKAGLDLVLSRCPNQTDGNIEGINSYMVFIHEPSKEPDIMKDALFLNMGQSTKIRVTRHLKKRQNHAADPCMLKKNYTKEACLRKCIASHCLVKINKCEILYTSENVLSPDESFSGYEIDHCLMAILIANGFDPSELQIFQVGRCIHLTSTCRFHYYLLEI